jgi:hypothetical protein
METRDAAEWLLHAESDLIYAKLGQAQAAILRNQVAFHAEQAAEKAFEAVLVHTAVEFPRTHDLQSLLLQPRNSGILVRPEIGTRSPIYYPCLVTTSFLAVTKTSTATNAATKSKTILNA